MKKKDDLDLVFLKDSPVLKSDPEYYGFYHDYISPTLSKITAKKGIHTIGLFGSWGSGKSTIIDNLKSDYKDVPLFIFDVWKYQGDPLRRTFLINLFRFIDKEKLWKENQELPSNFLDELYEDSSESHIEPVIEENIPTSGIKKYIFILKKYFIKNIFFIGIFFFLLLTLTLWVGAQYYLGESHPAIAFLLQIPGIISLSTVATFVILSVSKQVVDLLAKRIFENFSLEAKSLTIIKHREFLNSPEQFEEKFIKIIKRVSKKTIIVFDNIDRVQGDTAIEILSAIKTFIEPNDEANVIFIIPCDSNAIEEQIKHYYGSEKNPNFDPSEYLRKLFNVIVWTPDFIPTDLEDFTVKHLEQVGDLNGYLVGNDDLIRVIIQAFKSPREIKQFINNLLASIMVAHGTDVWDEVNKNIAYLAKVLVLRQKYPDAFLRLKRNWYKPEDIIEENDPIDFRNFMVSTSSIRVDNAEPYIYFKLSNTEKNFPDAKTLLPALASGNNELSKEIVSKHLANTDTLIEFILVLYNKYVGQDQWLTKIVKTFIEVIDELQVKISTKSYYNRTAEVIERYIWQSYRNLDTDVIFKLLIANTDVKKELRETLVERYVTALESQEIQQEADVLTGKAIIRNLISLSEINESSSSKLRKLIESIYIKIPDIFSLFNSIQLQKRFITSSALDIYIKQINSDFPNLLPRIIQYKSYINENNANNVLIQTLTAIANQERIAQPEHDGRKQLFYENLRELVTSPDGILDNTDTTLLVTLANEIMTTYRGYTAVDSKVYLVPVMFEIGIALNETNPEVETEIDGLISDFIKNSSSTTLLDLLKSEEEKRLVDIVNFYTQAFSHRAIVNGGDDISYAYEAMEESKKQLILNEIIMQSADAGINHIKSLSKLPDRVETIKKLIDRVQQISTYDLKKELYEYTASIIRLNDEVSLKDLVINHIKSLLASDDSANEEMGYILMTKGSYLNITQKRNIGDELIEWLRTPGKVIDNSHRFTLKSISSCFSQLQPTRRNDFVYILFEMLGRPDSRPTNEVALEAIVELNLAWKDYESYYADFKEKVDKWPNSDDRNYIIGEMIDKIKSQNVNKSEGEYWTSLEKMISGQVE